MCRQTYGRLRPTSANSSWLCSTSRSTPATLCRTAAPSPSQPRTFNSSGRRLPISLRAISLRERTSGEAAPRAIGGGKALLVDDNRDVLEVSAIYLQELGYEVHTMDSAQPALKAFEREKYSLVVSDIVMAGMDGIDLAREIRKRQPDMPIVLVTGYSRIPASVGQEFVLVRKPYQLPELGRAVSEAIAAASRPPSSNLVRLGD